MPIQEFEISHKLPMIRRKGGFGFLGSLALMVAGSICMVIIIESAAVQYYGAPSSTPTSWLNFFSLSIMEHLSVFVFDPMTFWIITCLIIIPSEFLVALGFKYI